jgi:type II secretory pathway pseudopilin PulG
MIIAIAMVGLVALSGAALAVSFAGDSRRTLMQSQNVQLRQLLLAGARTAQSAEKFSPEPISVPLPPSLMGDGARLTVQFEPTVIPQRRVANISAQLGGRHSSERIELAETGGKWRIVVGELGQ